MGSSRTGYVLVGGKSTRMGRDKARLPYRGRTLAETVAEAVRAAAGSAFLVGGPLAQVPDLYPGEGPLGGILTALHHSAAADWNLIVACDMPALRADFLRSLLDAAQAAGGDAFIPYGPSGQPEPLCAVYHRRSCQGLERAFRAGVRRISAALPQVSVVSWPVSEVAGFQNINTPEEWAAYER